MVTSEQLENEPALWVSFEGAEALLGMTRAVSESPESERDKRSEALRSLVTAAARSVNSLEISSDQLTAVLTLARAAQGSSEEDGEPLNARTQESIHRLLEEIEPDDLRKAFVDFCVSYGVRVGKP